MIRNYLKIAWRQLLKNKFITAVNLFGLVLGMSAAIFIYEYVYFERSYDTFHEAADDIYRIRTDRVKDGIPFMQFAAGAAFAGKIMKQFPEVTNYVKFKTTQGIYANGPDKSYREEDVYYVMPSVFEVFSFDLIQGDKKTALNEPFTACLSESMARKLFGDEDPMGKTFSDDGRDYFTVTGIFQDSPANSHLKFEILQSYVTFTSVYVDGDGAETNPYWDGYFTYVKLTPGTDYLALEKKIPAMIEQHYDAEVVGKVELYLQPLKDIHLTSNYLFEAELGGDDDTVHFLSIIGIIVLFIAWLNYINLSVARSILRTREVGVRKVVGSGRRSLVVQFLTETALVNILAIGLSLLAVKLFHGSFESLVGKDIPTTIFSEGNLLLVCLAVFLLGTFLSGLYPAFILSGVNPLQALKSGSQQSTGGKNNWLQRGLVVVQFTASVALVASTIVIYNQLNYMQQKKLGVNIDQTLVVKGPRAIDTTLVNPGKLFSERLEGLAQFDEVMGSTSVPGQPFGWTAGGIQRMDTGEQLDEGFHVMAVDYDYPANYEMALVAGEYVKEGQEGGENAACLINETALALLGYEKAEDAIGKGLSFWGDDYIINGVLADFHQESPKAVVEPLIMRGMPADWLPDYFSMKIKADQIPAVLASAEKTWSETYPGNPFEYFFLDEHFTAQYASDQRLGQVFTMFSGLAIIVSCLGLFALVAFMAERKKKEIGIRKVLGSSVAGIVALLSKDFVRLMLIALLIATPIAWYFMDGWLENFAERIKIQWWVFALAGIGSIVIALLTIGFQGVKAALVNPVDSLRSE
jgi:putative ABC transport system permease protein